MVRHEYRELWQKMLFIGEDGGQFHRKKEWTDITDNITTDNTTFNGHVNNITATKNVTLKNTELKAKDTSAPENTKTVVNIAEIQSASNVLRLDDIDSTPGNNKSSEDDLGRAEVIISIGTGTIIIIISAILGVFILIATSVVIIKKKVLRK